MFAYCNNNPVARYDPSGNAFDTVLDVISLGMSIADVVANPANPFAWGALAADAACLILPGISGGGGIVRFIAKADDLVDAVKYVDDVVDATKAIKSTPDIGRAMHDVYNPLTKLDGNGLNTSLGKLYDDIDSLLRPDAVDVANNIIYELKPYNSAAFKRAINQTQKYANLISKNRQTCFVVIDMYY